jgi:hypothetical protein
MALCVALRGETTTTVTLALSVALPHEARHVHRYLAPSSA